MNHAATILGCIRCNVELQKLCRGSLAAYGNIRNRVEQGGVVEYCTEMQNRCSDGSGAGVNLKAMNNL